MFCQCLQSLLSRSPLSKTIYFVFYFYLHFYFCFLRSAIRCNMHKSNARQVFGVLNANMRVTIIVWVVAVLISMVLELAYPCISSPTCKTKQTILLQWWFSYMLNVKHVLNFLRLIWFSSAAILDFLFAIIRSGKFFFHWGRKKICGKNLPLFEVK